MTLEMLQYITFAYGGYINFTLACIGLLCVCHAFKAAIYAAIEIIDQRSFRKKAK